MVAVGDTVTATTHTKPGVVVYAASNGSFYVEGPGWGCWHFPEVLRVLEGVFSRHTLDFLDGSIGIMADPFPTSNVQPAPEVLADLRKLRRYVQERVA